MANNSAKVYTSRFGWSNGMITSANPIQPPGDSAAWLENAEVSMDGAVAIRRGLESLGQRITDSGVQKAIAGWAEYKTATAHQLVIAAGTKWYGWDVPGDETTGLKDAPAALTGASSFTEGAPWHFVRWNYGNSTQDWLIGCNGTDDVQYYDGTSVQSLGLTRTYACMESYNGWLFGAEQNSEQVWRSGTLFNATTEADVDYPLDGEDGLGVVALRKHGGVLYVFGTNVIETITGYSPSDFQNQPFVTGHGTVAQESVRSTKQGLFFLDTDGVYAVWPTDGTDRPVARVSLAIDDVFRSLDFSKLSNVWSCVYQHRNTKRQEYRLGFTLDGERDTNTYVVRKDLDTDSPFTGWRIDSGYEARCLLVGRDYNSVPVLYSGRKNGSFYRHDFEVSDGNQPVPFALVDQPFDFSGSIELRGDIGAYEKTLDDLWIYYQANMPAELLLKIVANFNEEAYSEYITLTPNSTVAPLYQFTQRANLKHPLEYMQSNVVDVHGLGIGGKSFQIGFYSNTGWRDIRIQGYIAGGTLSDAKVP